MSHFEKERVKQGTKSFIIKPHMKHHKICDNIDKDLSTRTDAMLVWNNQWTSCSAGDREVQGSTNNPFNFDGLLSFTLTHTQSAEQEQVSPLHRQTCCRSAESGIADDARALVLAEMQ